MRRFLPLQILTSLLALMALAFASENGEANGRLFRRSVCERPCPPQVCEPTVGVSPPICEPSTIIFPSVGHPHEVTTDCICPVYEFMKYGSYSMYYALKCGVGPVGFTGPPGLKGICDGNCNTDCFTASFLFKEKHLRALPLEIVANHRFEPDNAHAKMRVTNELTATGYYHGPVSSFDTMKRIYIGQDASDPPGKKIKVVLQGVNVTPTGRPNLNLFIGYEVQSFRSDFDARFIASKDLQARQIGGGKSRAYYADVDGRSCIIVLHQNTVLP